MKIVYPEAIRRELEEWWKWTKLFLEKEFTYEFMDTHILLEKVTSSSKKTTWSVQLNDG